MMYADAFLKRSLLVGAISALSLVNVSYGHGGGGGGKGTGGSSGGGSASSGSSSSGGHSASSNSGGHSATASGHAVTASAHTATVSKNSRDPHDPPNVSQSMVNPTENHIRVFRIFQQVPSTGYTTQYREINNDDWRRKHQRLFLGFIRY